MSLATLIQGIEVMILTCLKFEQDVTLSGGTIC